MLLPDRIFHLLNECFDFYRGENFRREFLSLDEIRSSVPETVRVMALTTTATKSTRLFIIKILCMQSPEIDSVSPDKENAMYAVLDKPTW